MTHLERGKTAGTLPGFRLMGVPVRLHFTFILFVLFLLVTFLGGARGGSNYAIFLAGAVISLLLHELGHAAMAAHFGYRTVEVVMFPIGGLSRMERPLKPAAEAWVSAAGPIINLILAGGIFGYMMLMHQQPANVSLKDMLNPSESAAAALLLYANVMFAVFNLLPAFPMDGGRLLRALLSYVRPHDEATRIAAWMGRMLAMGMGLYGLVDKQFLLVFFALFIYLGAAQEGVAAFGRTLTHGIPARAAMITDFHTLEHGNTVRDAANLLLSTSQQDFPGDAQRSRGRNAGPESAFARDRQRRAGGLRRRRDGSRIYGVGTERRSGGIAAGNGSRRPLRAGDRPGQAAGPAHHGKSVRVSPAAPLWHGARALTLRRRRNPLILEPAHKNRPAIPCERRVLRFL